MRDFVYTLSWSPLPEYKERIKKDDLLFLYSKEWIWILVLDWQEERP